MTYTCVGDTVNLAAHLEAHTKVVGQPILIDENTRAGLGDGIRVESHRPAQFKTKSQAVPVYSVPPGQQPRADERLSSGSTDRSSARLIHLGPRGGAGRYDPAYGVAFSSALYGVA